LEIGTIIFTTVLLLDNWRWHGKQFIPK